MRIGQSVTLSGQNAEFASHFSGGRTAYIGDVQSHSVHKCGAKPNPETAIRLSLVGQKLMESMGNRRGKEKSFWDRPRKMKRCGRNLRPGNEAKKGGAPFLMARPSTLVTSAEAFSANDAHGHNRRGHNHNGKIRRTGKAARTPRFEPAELPPPADMLQRVRDRFQPVRAHI
jgi:hypothetical protein